MTHAPPSDGNEASSRHTFPRTHRLKRRRLIRSLFDRSRTDVGTLASGCVRLVYRVVPREAIGHDVPLQIGFAPGRRVQNAVQRNRVRRVLREVYRVHQYLLVDLFVRRKDALIVMVLFRGDPAAAGDCIPRDLPTAMRRVADRFLSDAAAS
jgi:ribonuclease P protein component